MSGLQTEFPFTLPKGFVDEDGTLHRTGVMRLACARDEIEPLRDARVKENEAYATVIVLSRVVVQLGSVARVTPRTIESLFVSDYAHLQDVYRVINFGDSALVEALQEEGDGFGGGSFGGGDAGAPFVPATVGTG